MQPTTTPALLPHYASWLSPEQVGQQVGASAVVVTQWIVTGIKTESGRIRLAAVKVGGRWKIEPAAISAFIAQTTTAALPESATDSAAVANDTKPRKTKSLGPTNPWVAERMAQIQRRK